MSGKIAVDLYVGDSLVKNNEYTKDFNGNSNITLDTSISDLKTQLDNFFKTKGQTIDFFQAGRDDVVFSDDMNAKLENFAGKIGSNDKIISNTSGQGRSNFFNVVVDLKPLSPSGGKRRRKTIKKRKVGKKRRTNKKRRVYRRK